MADKIKAIEKISKGLFDQVDLKVDLKVGKQDGDVFAIQIETDQPGILIGYHGQTLSALQLLIGMMLFKQSNEWVRVLVNVGDYREKRKEMLENMAKASSQKVKATGQIHRLPPMPSIERRIIHLFLADDSQVETTSEGEGRDRHIVIKLKS